MSYFNNSVNLNSGTAVKSFNDDIANSMTPGLLGILLFVIVIYYYLFYSLGLKVAQAPTQAPSFGAMAIELLLWSLFVVLIIINALQYYYEIDVTAEIKNLFSGEPKIDITIAQPVEEEDTGPAEIAIQKQVFHLKDNKYTYDNAKAVCKAYGARLANYDDMEKAHREGGEWCNYGWSDNQSALFPTQKATWEKLQNIKGHENDCGRPGINGGYIANPNVKFGVNCYGFKPKMNLKSRHLMDNNEIYPKTEKEIEFENKVKKWKKEINNLVVAPFNGERWSVI